MPTEIQQIQQFFKDHDVAFSPEWLHSCIEWCKDGELPPNYTLKDLQRMIYEQWLILDIRDIEIPSLPRNLSSEKRYSLSGSYCLQIIQVVDISKPKLWQLQRIRRNVAKNTEAEKDFGKRVLQLTLTDGVQEVEAMEFERIPCLNINLLPGTKIKVTGPLMVRNGRLMLKEENVKCLGGAVDDIRVKYAAENILARALGLEENPNPYTVDENALEVTEANTNTQVNSTANAQNFNAVNQSRNQNQNYQSQPKSITGLNQNTTRTQNAVNNRQSINQEIPPEFQVDDDLLRELEADFEQNSFSRHIKSTKTNNTNLSTNTKASTVKSNENDRSRECSSPDLFGEMEVDDELLNEHLDQIDVDHMASNVRSTASINMSSGLGHNVTNRLDSGRLSSESAENVKFVNNQEERGINRSIDVVQDLEISSSEIAKVNDIDNVITLDDSFDDIDIDSHLDNIDEEMANLPSSTQKRNDLKDRLKSPEIKTRRDISNYSKNVQDVNSATLTLRKPPKTVKKLTQGTLQFGSLKRDVKNVSSTSKDNLHFLPPSPNFSSFQAEHQNPFNILTNLPQKPVPIRYVLPEFPSASKTTVNPPQKPPNTGSPDFASKYVPGTSSPLSNLPQNSGPLSPEPHYTSPTSSKITNVLSIEKLKKMLPNIGKGKFKIKGKFKKVADKLQHRDGSYQFVIVVEDVTGELTVQMHSDIVTNIAGTGPEELERLRVLALQQNQEVKNRIIKVLMNLHQRCLTLDNILEIEVTRGAKYPVMINII